MVRAAIVILVALVLAFQVIRAAAVQRASARALIGARMWPAHPAVITDQAMGEIGASARRGEPLSAATVRKVKLIADRSPLAVEPFLIAGAVAQASSNEFRAQRLFEEARARDPRSEAARYFLADRYLRSGRTAEALSEMAVFSRLVPTASAQFAPALASFARTPGVAPQMRRFFRSSPEFEPLVLSYLARDADDTDLVLSLARPGLSQQAWQPQLVAALLDRGQFAKAQAVWAKLSGVRGEGRAIFNPGFQETRAPPPFNWAFATSGGVAEPAGNGRLQVVYYGRDDVILAQQVLLLGPGRYRLAMGVAGQPGDGSFVAWTIRCLPQSNPIFSLSLQQGQRAAEGSFSVPENCQAQRLELAGSIGEFPQSLNFTIGNLRLVKEAAR